MNYKDLKGYLIAFDLDNTSVTGFDNYDKESFEILKELSINNYVVIATGRPFRSSSYFYDLLGLKTPIINYNGAYVHNPKDNNFKEIMITIDHKKLNKFVNDNSNVLVNIFSEIKDDIYLLHEGEEVKAYVHSDGGITHIGKFDNILHDDPNGAILFSKENSEQILQNYVDKNFNEVLLRHYWISDNILISELYNPLTSKANALNEIIKYYNIDKDKTIAFGDGINDLEMLEFVKYGVAMGNGHPDLLKQAKYNTLSVNEHGIKYFFDKFDFKK